MYICSDFLFICLLSLLFFLLWFSQCVKFCLCFLHFNLSASVSVFLSVHLVEAFSIKLQVWVCESGFKTDICVNSLCGCLLQFEVFLHPFFYTAVNIFLTLVFTSQPLLLKCFRLCLFLLLCCSDLAFLVFLKIFTLCGNLLCWEGFWKSVDMNLCLSAFCPFLQTEADWLLVFLYIFSC